jgi:hypothetical protein
MSIDAFDEGAAVAVELENGCFVELKVVLFAVGVDEK